MALRVVGSSAAQAVEEDGDQLAGQVAHGHRARHAASSQTPVVVAERGVATHRREQLPAPEPELASSQTVAAPAQAVPGEAAAGLVSFRVPPEQLAQLAVVAEAGDVADAGEQDRLPHDGHDGEAGEDDAILSGPLFQDRTDGGLDLLDLTVEEAELVEQ